MNQNDNLNSENSSVVVNSRLTNLVVESDASRTTSDEIAISVRNLTKIYRLYESPQHRLREAIHPFRKKYHRDFRALDDLSFNVKRGETVGIIGSNGCGKSTLLQMIAGTLTPTSGDVIANGRVAALLELGTGFNPILTGRENVYYNGMLLGISRDEMDRRFESILSFAGIGEFIDQPLRTFSSGMVVRLAFSVAINIEPDILIVDEALAVGDAAFQYKCVERLERVTKSGTTLLFVSHDMGLIKSFCHHVIYLQNGREKASGSPEGMAELYLLDMRDEQRRSLSAGSRVMQKPSLGGSEAIAFGTEQGRVVKAWFSDTGSQQSSYVSGDSVSIAIEVEYLESVTKPSLDVMIKDRKLLDVSGSFSLINKAQRINGVCHAHMVCSFKASLGEGSYFVTVVLADRSKYKAYMPIDKQVGILSFQISQPKPATFQGVVDLAMDFSAEQIDFDKSY